MLIPAGQILKNRAEPRMRRALHFSDFDGRQRIGHRADDPDRHHITDLRLCVVDMDRVQIFRFTQHLALITARFFH